MWKKWKGAFQIMGYHNWIGSNSLFKLILNENLQNHYNKPSSRPNMQS